MMPSVWNAYADAAWNCNLPFWVCWVPPATGWAAWSGPCPRCRTRGPRAAAPWSRGACPACPLAGDTCPHPRGCTGGSRGGRGRARASCRGAQLSWNTTTVSLGSFLTSRHGAARTASERCKNASTSGTSAFRCIWHMSSWFSITVYSLNVGKMPKNGVFWQKKH